MSESKDRILTIPNLVSFIRLLGVFAFWWVLLARDDVVLAGWLVFIIGWTDWVDGYLARRLDQVSELGKMLDPIADRLMIASAVIGGLIVGVLPGVIGYGIILREAMMGLIALLLLSKGARQLEVRLLGKAATFALYGAIPAFYVAEGEVLSGLFTFIAWFFGTLGLILYWIVAFQYVGDARANLADVESGSDSEEV